MTRMTDDKANLRVQGASVAVATTLVLAKLWAFYMTGALSVAASLADSGLDLLVSLGGLWAIRYAQRPPDRDHTFGHSSAEDLVAFVQSAFIMISAFAIVTAALSRIGEDPRLGSEGAGIAVMVLSIVLTLALVTYQTRVTRQTGNRVVAADRLHYIGDLLPNLGAILALAVSSLFDVGMIDTLVALLAAVILAAGALRIGARAWDALMDRAAPDELNQVIDRLVADHSGIEGHHDLRTRTAGARIFINLHLEMDGQLSLDAAHEIGEEIRREIVALYPQADVIIHHDPV